MILILSSADDVSTNEVIDWLIYSQITFIRINIESIVKIKLLKIPECKIIVEINKESKFEKIEIDLNEITGYWYRRDDINIDTTDVYLNKNENLNICINEYLRKELAELYRFLHLFLERRHGVGKFSENKTNKLYNLIVAYDVGFNIPNTYVVTNKEQFAEINPKNKKLITKDIGSNIIKYKNFVVGGYTEQISEKDNNDYNSSFPSLFQEKIEKKYELRVNHLDGKNYTSAIFSQKSKQTSTDFRKYSTNKPNRVVPFILPGKINSQVNQFMKKTGMKSGSLDVIVDKDNKYIFLEVNPIGQFNQVSKPCNYCLEKEIAKYLSMN